MFRIFYWKFFLWGVVEWRGGSGGVSSYFFDPLTITDSVGVGVQFQQGGASQAKGG